MSTELVEEVKSEITITDTEMAELLERVYNAECDCQEAEREVERRSNLLKSAKNLLDARISNLRKLSSQLHELLRGNKLDADRPLLNQASPSSDAPTEPAAWRSLTTELLLTPPIEGFGMKKRQALLDALPTLGDFEDLRARVGRDAATLRELLPKGIGEQAADALEERLITVIRQNGITDTPTVAEAATDAPDPISDLQTQAVQLVDLWKSNREEFDKFAINLPDDHIMSGAEAYHDGDEVENCPFVLGTDEQYAWVFGWVSEYVADPTQMDELADDADAEEVETSDASNELSDAPDATDLETTEESEPEPELEPAVVSVTRSLTPQQLLDEL